MPYEHLTKFATLAEIKDSIEPDLESRARTRKILTAKVTLRTNCLIIEARLSGPWTSHSRDDKFTQFFFPRENYNRD